MKLNQPYYIEPRSGSNHISLNGSWDFAWCDDVADIGSIDWCYSADLPKSVYHCLHQAGVLPDPYVGTNSKLYHWVDEKVWYFRKRFDVECDIHNRNVFLCFDGAAYYSRVWVNGKLLGDHEGMYGGPVCDIAQYAIRGKNEVVVEIKACNYGIKDSFDSWNPQGTNTQIVPWNLARDTCTSNGDFIVMGLWNNVRIEITDKLHISRPYMYTKQIDGDSAQLFLEFEIADGTVEELKPYYGYDDDCYSYTRAYDSGLSGRRSKQVEIRITMTEGDTGRCVYSSTDNHSLADYERLGMDKNYWELEFFSKNITIDNPRLWYPNGMGEPYLYDVEIQLVCDGCVCDTHSFKTGIRTFTSSRTAGPKYRTRWENFLFSINGRQFFVKGINWMPIDFLYDISPDEYEWCLTLAKNAGIQMLRVWSGGGMIETDTFYELCDKLGIMVWQDHMLANMENTSNYPQDILESQEAYNIYRIRNHPSLVLHCGGNEFNPYNKNNAASMFVISRIVRELDPARIFHYTSADKGSGHVYNDMEPVWYRHIYKDLPYLAESGIHSFPSFKTLTKLIDDSECRGIMCDLASEEFVQRYPQLLNHFTEYRPDRVPRMMARASQIADITQLTLKDMCEATHVQAYEFFNLMIQSMRENYPRCGGVMPWVFKRHWATVGIQMVDGAGQCVYSYYALKNAYKPLNVCFCQQWSVIAPEENVPLEIKIFNDDNVNLNNCKVSVTVFRPDMTVAVRHSAKATESRFVFEDFVPGEEFTDKCFLICADIDDNGKSLARSVYFVKCTSALSDKELLAKYRSEPCENMNFSRGPWLRDSIQNAEKAQLYAGITGVEQKGNYINYYVNIENSSSVAAYPVTIDCGNVKCRYFTDDNFFLMYGGESRQICITVDGLNMDDNPGISVQCWNGGKAHMEA